MVRPAGLPLRVLSHGRALLSRAVADDVTAAIPAAAAVTVSATLGPVLTVAAPEGPAAPRTTTRVHDDWPSQMLHAAQFQPRMRLCLCVPWLPPSVLYILCSHPCFIVSSR